MQASAIALISCWFLIGTWIAQWAGMLNRFFQNFFGPLSISGLVLTLSAAMFPAAARASVTPWTSFELDDLKIVSDVKVEQGVRLEMIARARKSIDLVIFDQRADEEYALPVLRALRQAADRGVRIRFLTPEWTQMTTDLMAEAPRFLTDPPAREPIQYVLFPGSAGSSRGWKAYDAVHEKLLIVDGKWVLTTGRGHAKIYETWIDTAFLIRGPLVLSTIETFQAVWKAALLESGLYEPLGFFHRHYRPVAPGADAQPAMPALSEAQQRSLSELRAWFSDLSICTEAGARLARGRVLHHDMIAQLSKDAPNLRETSFEKRMEILNDDVVNALIAKLPGSRRVRIDALSVIMSDKLKDALIDASRKGADISIFTNGEEAMKTVIPVPVALPWPVSLPYIEQLMSAGIEVRVFEPKEQMTYLHRKLAIVDDTVIFGSHNFNLPSSVTNDEVSFEVESPRLRYDLMKLHEQDAAYYGRALELKDVQAERASTVKRRWVFEEFMPFF